MEIAGLLSPLMRRGICLVNLAGRVFLAVFLLAGCASPEHTLVGPKGRATSPWFGAITNFSSFQAAAQQGGLELVLTSPVLSTPLAWDELVISWNGSFPAGTGLTVEARAVGGGHGKRYFVLGRWAADRAAQPRESVPGQNDPEGEVRTDTLSLKFVATALQLRLTLTATSGARERAQVRFLGLSFIARSAPVVALDPLPLRAAWGRELAVPGRSQLSYQGGRDWCSPTSVSMVLAYWAERLQRPELDREVPEVAQGVFDPAWPGTGNWTFNTAFAGQFAGMRAFVARLPDVRALEQLVTDDVPPILSVSFDLLHGKSEDRGGGHLVVCAGFTKEGDFVLNDPWARPGESVRRTVPRQQVLRAWSHSRQTAYIIRPESWLRGRGY